MKNIIRFLKGSGKAVILIVLLLFLQAYCDLALPDLTSDLLNIGLQQNGIEHAAPETIREESLKTLEIFVPEAEIADLEAAYSEADSGGIRSLQADADIEKISGILALPESAVFQMENSGASGSIAAFRAGLATGLLTKEKILDGIREKLDAYAAAVKEIEERNRQHVEDWKREMEAQAAE